MKIHLSKPGGQREGPFTVEQIKSDLAARKYNDTDYWAWHEGLTEWVPLHSLAGVRTNGDAPSSAGDAVEPEERAEAEAGGTVALSCAAASTIAVAAPEEPGLESAEELSGPQPQLSSGMAFAALEQIFMLTSGEGQPASRSEVTAGMLEAITGQELSAVRENVPRHVMVHCGFLEKVRGGGPIPEEAWRAVTRVNPELVRQAREGIYRVCVRSFPLETGDMASLFLFYNKQRL